MRVLVTGLEGFTGAYLKPALEATGHQVIGLQADITDTVSLAEEVQKINPDAVVHLAAITFVAHDNADDFYRVNLIGTRNLLSVLAVHAPNVKSVLLASSANVYGNHTEGCLTESTACIPTNDYAVSKLAMEHMAALWQDKLPLFIVRPFNYTGVGQAEHFLIPKIVKHFKNKSDVIELGNIHVSRDFGDVRTVVSVYAKLLTLAPIGQTINVCTGEAHCLEEILALCERMTEHTIDVKINPAYVRANEVNVLIGNNARLRSLLPKWQAPNIEETLRWMLEDE